MSSCDFTHKEKEKLALIEDGANKSSQSDWNTIDPNDKSYILNRPYEISYKDPIFTWDGNINGRVMSTNGYWCKVSDYIPNEKELSNFMISVRDAGNPSNAVDTKAGLSDEYGEDGVIFLNDYLAFVKIADPEYIFPETGIYSIYYKNGIYVKSVQFVRVQLGEQAISSKIARLTDMPCGIFNEYIAWDGNEVDRTELNYTNMLFYKVSESVPEKNELDGCICVFSAFGELPISSEYIMDMTEEYGMYIATYMNYIPLFIVVTNSELASTRFGKIVSNGIYFLKLDDETYVSELALSEKIKYIDETYIPDTIARVSDIPEQVVVDDVLSDSSTNPVQNKVINNAISNLNTLVGGESVATQIENAILETKEYVNNLVISQARDSISLVDQVNGQIYIISMRDGNLVSTLATNSVQ